MGTDMAICNEWYLVNRVKEQHIARRKGVEDMNEHTKIWVCVITILWHILFENLNRYGIIQTIIEIDRQ